MSNLKSDLKSNKQVSMCAVRDLSDAWLLAQRRQEAVYEHARRVTGGLAEAIDEAVHAGATGSGNPEFPKSREKNPDLVSALTMTTSALEWSETCVCATSAQMRALEQGQGPTVAALVALEARRLWEQGWAPEQLLSGLGAGRADATMGLRDGIGGPRGRVFTTTAFMPEKRVSVLRSTNKQRMERKVGNLDRLYSSKARIEAIRRQEELRHLAGSYDRRLLEALLGAERKPAGAAVEMYLGDVTPNFEFDLDSAIGDAGSTDIDLMSVKTKKNVFSSDQGDRGAASSWDEWGLGLDMAAYLVNGTITPFVPPTHTHSQQSKKKNKKKLPHTPPSVTLRWLGLLDGCAADALACQTQGPDATMGLHRDRSPEGMGAPRGG
jgi:hypothetical protein